MPDKYSATWVSHSSISDYLACPKSYYLKNVYRNPKTNKKINITSPALSLGSAVHNVIEELSTKPVDERLNKSLFNRFEEEWEKVSGKKGGFTNPETEKKYKQRGLDMISRVSKNPGPLLKKAVKIQMDLPWFWLSEEDNIILCGKIDWLQYDEEDDSVHIIDFKTGKNEESGKSLQLPIYHLLVDRCQKRKVSGASYWYLGKNTLPSPVELPDLDEAEEEVLTVAKKVALARKLEAYECPEGDSCKYCRDYQRVVNGEGEMVGHSSYGDEVYILPWEGSDKKEQEENREGEIL